MPINLKTSPKTNPKEEFVTINLTDLEYQKLEQVFRGGSKTYFNSSLFFEPKLRQKIVVLYAFVRTADDIVDGSGGLETKKQLFDQFCDYYQQAQAEKFVDPNYLHHLVITSFVTLQKQNGFDPTWTEAFLGSMRADVEGVKYKTWFDTTKYIYGSANVIGLYMAKLLDLPPESYPSAQKLGMAMQLINFIRDIKEDISLGRSYFPTEILSKLGFETFDEQALKKHPERFEELISQLLAVFDQWQKQGEAGFEYIPKKYLVPIKTASDVYKWTAKTIKNQPQIVFQKKVKPSKIRILAYAISNWLTIWK